MTRIESKSFNFKQVPWCYGLNAFVSPKLICWSLMLSGMVGGGGASGRWLGYEDRALMNGIRALIKEAQESSPQVGGHCRELPVRVMLSRVTVVGGQTTLQPQMGRISSPAMGMSGTQHRHWTSAGIGPPKAQGQGHSEPCDPTSAPGHPEDTRF